VTVPLEPELDAGRLLVALANLEAFTREPAPAAVYWAIGEGWTIPRYQAAFDSLRESGLVAKQQNAG